MSFTDVEIKSQIGIETREANDVMPGSAEDFGDLRKVCELSSCLGRRRLTFGARRDLAVGVARGGSQMEKSA